MLTQRFSHRSSSHGGATENTTKKPLTSQENLLKTTEKPTHFPTSQAITKEKDLYSLNSVEPNITTNPLKTQDLSPLELAKAEKLAKLESEQLESEKEFLANHQIFLKEAKDNAIKDNATNQTNKTESLEAIGQPKRAS